MTRLHGIIDKAWGYENIWVSNDHYCSKILHFNEGAKFSMHFHQKKIETWYVLSGEFIVEFINTDNATIHHKELHEGDVWHNPQSSPHRLICIRTGDIIEVSTEDSVEDNYRILPGDSQS